MNKMFRFVRVPAAGALLGALALRASAQTASNPLTDALTSIDLSTVAAAVAVIVLAIIGICLAFKGADLGKRAVRKV
jgi:type IV secretory pathway VirB2 component (pilin)